MKNKYNMRLIWNYINGEEINNIDELESDYRFMMQVMKVSQDKKMYNLCSDEIRNNYEFVKFIIDTFKDDKDFIDEVARDYLKKTSKDDLTHIELIFIMSNYFSKYSDKSLYYNAKAFSFYTHIKALIDFELVIEDDEDLGLGFILVLVSDFGQSKVVAKYFANKFVENIFYKHHTYKLEELLHMQHDSFDSIKKEGIKNYILNYIKTYDTSLADFLHTNYDILEKLESDFIKIGKNWDNYNETTNDTKKDIFEQEAMTIICENTAKFSYHEVCHYIDNLKIINTKLYEDDDTLCETIDISSMDLVSYRSLKEIINLALELFSSQVINKKEKYLSNNLGQVLEFKKRKKGKQ